MIQRNLRCPLLWFALVASTNSVAAQSGALSVEDLGSCFDSRFEPRPARTGEVLRLALSGSHASRVIALDWGGGQVLWNHEGPELHGPLERPHWTFLNDRPHRLASSTRRGQILVEPIDAATGWPTGPPSPVRFVAGLERMPVEEPITFGDCLLLPVWTDREAMDIYVARFTAGASELRDEEALSLRVARHPTFASGNAPVHFVCGLVPVSGSAGVRPLLATVASSDGRRAAVVLRADPLEIERVVELPLEGTIVDLRFALTDVRPGSLELDGWIALEREGRTIHARYDRERGRFVQVFDVRGTYLAGPLPDDDGAVWFAASSPGSTDMTHYRVLDGRFGASSLRVPVRDGWPLSLRGTTGGTNLAVLHRHGVTPLGCDGGSLRPLDAALVDPLRTACFDPGNDWWLVEDRSRGARLEPIDRGNASDYLGIRYEGNSTVVTRLRAAREGTPWRVVWQTQLGAPREPRLLATRDGWLVRTHDRVVRFAERGLSRTVRSVHVEDVVREVHVLPDGRIVTLGDSLTLLDSDGGVLARELPPIDADGSRAALLETDSEAQAVRVRANGDAYTGWTTGNVLNGARWKLGDVVRGIGTLDALASHGAHLYLAAGDQVFRLRLSLEDGRPVAWDVLSIRSFLSPNATDVPVVDRLFPHADGVVVALRSVGQRRMLSIGWEDGRPVLRARIAERMRAERYEICGGYVFRLDRDVRFAPLRSSREEDDEEFVELPGVDEGRLGAVAVDGSMLYFQMRSREGAFLHRVEGTRAVCIGRSVRFAVSMVVRGGRLLGLDAYGQIFRMDVR
ncbi:MAG: hypothetical protein H6834_06875 [Planctomycetes bacterium]|nr:hypothetical protein [Planctomycetota bacterium]